MVNGSWLAINTPPTPFTPLTPPMPLLDDLLREFPDLTPKKDELTRILSAMERSGPPPALDKAFVDQLRRQLLTMPEPVSPLHSFFSSMQQKTFALAGAAIAIALLLPAGYALWKINNGGSTLVSKNAAKITMLESGAFGNLSEATSLGSAEGKGGSSMMGSAESSSALVAEDKRMAEDGMFIEPFPYEPTIYTYTFDGDLASYLEDVTATVYERQGFSGFDGTVLDAISSSFSPLNLRSFLDGTLTSFVLKADNHFLSVDTTGNMWSIYKDWASYGMIDSWTPLAASDIPTDEAIISSARDFANMWGIQLDGYGDPLIAEPEVSLARSGDASVYIPESATVVFPMLIDGQQVYPSWSAAPTGLRVSVNLRDLSVTNAYDALNQSYNASSYALTQDTALVKKLIAGGGSAPITSVEGIAYDEVTVALNAPERVLMEYSLYENGQSRTLFIPALRFTMQDPAQIPWTSGVITIPLVKDIAEAQASVDNGVVMPMVK